MLSPNTTKEEFGSLMFLVSCSRTGPRRMGVHAEAPGSSCSTAKEFRRAPGLFCVSPFAPLRSLVPSPRWRARRVSPVGGTGTGAGRVSIAAVSHRGTSWSEAAGPGAASRDAPLGKAAEGGPGKRRKPSKCRDKPAFAPAIVRAGGGRLDPSTAGVRGDGARACVCKGAAPDPPLKRAGSSRLRGGGRYHPPPGGAGTPPRGREVEVAGAVSRRVLGYSDCSIPSGGVCVCVFPALSAGNRAARGGLRDAAETGGLGEPGGTPGKALWGCPRSHCKVGARCGGVRSRSQSGAGGLCVGVRLRESRL